MTVFPSLCDPFDQEVPIEWFGDFLELIHATPNLKWLLLTKRPQFWYDRVSQVHSEIAESWIDCVDMPERGVIPPNVAIGVSAENQAAWDDRVPKLLEIPAAMRFVSVEPMLGPIDPHYACFNGADSFGMMPGIDWVIIGGESGPLCRQMDLGWMWSLADDCQISGVPVEVKQDSGLRPGKQGRIPEALWKRKQKPTWLKGPR